MPRAPDPTDEIMSRLYFYVNEDFMLKEKQSQNADYSIGSPCGHSSYEAVHLLWTLFLLLMYNVNNANDVHY